LMTDDDVHGDSPFVTRYVTCNVTCFDITCQPMGRPREHDDQTRAALRAAAERLVTEGGPAALSVRAVADAAGTTTRAVYSLFGSKEGLLVDALAQDAFAFLFTEIDNLEETDDPVADLIAVGLPVFRRLVLEHPALYRVAFQRVVPGLDGGPELVAARQKTWVQLLAKIERLRPAGLLGDKPTTDAALEFIAISEGLANAELRGAVLRLLPEGNEEQAWRNALTTVVRGWGASTTDDPKHRRVRAAPRKS
jgi:AcrR family transcriptional regulator